MRETAIFRKVLACPCRRRLPRALRAAAKAVARSAPFPASSDPVHPDGRSTGASCVRIFHLRQTGTAPAVPARHRLRRASTGPATFRPPAGAAGVRHAVQPARRHALNPSTRQTPAAVHCTSCDAVCCRLTVVLGSEDDVPAHLTTRLHGLRVMARDPEGWCVALDGQRMNCRIYASRPAICRSFVMGGPYCRAVRDEYAHPGSRTIESTLA